MIPAWLPPLERHLRHTVDPVWHSLPAEVWDDDHAGPMRGVLRRFLVACLDEAVSHVTVDEWGVRDACAEVRRLLVEGGADEEWDAAVATARDAAWVAARAARAAAAAARAAWAARDAARATARAAWAARDAEAAARAARAAAARAAWAAAWVARSAIGTDARQRLAIALNDAIYAAVTTTPTGLLWLAKHDHLATPGSPIRRLIDSLDEGQLVALDYAREGRGAL